MVSLGARRPFRNLCRGCWGVETRSSNSRLISALNEMTRGVPEAPRARGRTAMSRSGQEDRAAAGASDRRRKVTERREDPERPRWHP